MYSKDKALKGIIIAVIEPISNIANFSKLFCLTNKLSRLSRSIGYYYSDSFFSMISNLISGEL